MAVVACLYVNIVTYFPTTIAKTVAFVASQSLTTDLYDVSYHLVLLLTSTIGWKLRVSSFDSSYFTSCDFLQTQIYFTCKGFFLCRDR